MRTVEEVQAWNADVHIASADGSDGAFRPPPASRTPANRVPKHPHDDGNDSGDRDNRDNDNRDKDNDNGENNLDNGGKGYQGHQPDSFRWKRHRLRGMNQDTPVSRGQSSRKKRARRTEDDADREAGTMVHQPGDGEQDQSSWASQESPATQHATEFSNMTSLPPTMSSASVSHTTSTRSRSPMKRPDDLLKLLKPVRWVDLSDRDLSTAVAATNSEGAVALFSNIKRMARSRKGHLPAQLRPLLMDELALGDDDSDKFATREPISLGVVALDEAKSAVRRIFTNDTLSDAELEDAARLRLPLEEELRQLRHIVSRTSEYKSTPHAEASWNEQIHGPILDMATRHLSSVDFENVTRANIARPFLPQATSEMASIAMASKMIDYAVILKVDDDAGADNIGQRLRNFVATLQLPTFNQTTYPPLCNWPTGIMIETKANSSDGWAEGKAQLGFWLAAWFKRVSMFPTRPFSTPPPKLPLLPVLLVVGAKWELYFAFENAFDYRIYGKLDIGSTDNLEDAYQLLAVLRLLARDWVASEFRAWVEARLDFADTI